MRKTGTVIILIGSVLSIVPALGVLDLAYEAKATLEEFIQFMEHLTGQPAPNEGADFFAAIRFDIVLTAGWTMVFCSGAAVLLSGIAAKVRARFASFLVLVPLGLGAWRAYPFLGGEMRMTVLAYLATSALAVAGALIMVLASAAPAREDKSG